VIVFLGSSAWGLRGRGGGRDGEHVASGGSGPGRRAWAVGGVLV